MTNWVCLYPNDEQPTLATSKPAFPNWAEWLRADPALAPGVRESYRRIVEEFLQYCAARAGGVTTEQAREFVALARLREAPSPARLREWQEGLNWFFRRGRVAREAGLQGVPPLARTDLGAASWEVALIAYLRQRGRSWRTEQTYRGWLWRFVRWLGQRPVAEAGAAEVREFLSQLAVQERVGVATQKQALNALMVYFREVEGRELGAVGDGVSTCLSVALWHGDAVDGRVKGFASRDLKKVWRMLHDYVLQSESDDGLYIGFWTDLRRRLQEHQEGEVIRNLLSRAVAVD